MPGKLLRAAAANFVFLGISLSHNRHAASAQMVHGSAVPRGWAPTYQMNRSTFLMTCNNRGCFKLYRRAREGHLAPLLSPQFTESHPLSIAFAGDSMEVTDRRSFLRRERLTGSYHQATTPALSIPCSPRSGAWWTTVRQWPFVLTALRGYFTALSNA